jgi:hypothetical protein
MPSVGCFEQKDGALGEKAEVNIQRYINGAVILTVPFFVFKINTTNKQILYF